MKEIIQTGHWINGKETKLGHKEKIEVFDPGTGEIIGFAVRGDLADVDLAIQTAFEAFHKPNWRASKSSERGRLMWELARKVEKEKEQIARLLSLENGKPISQSYDEVDTVVRNFEYYSGWVDKIHGRVVPIQNQVLDYICYEPLGVVCHIIPWNYPIDIFARGVAPCLAIGNTVVVKPAEETPFSTLEIARLATSVGFPDGVINVVTGFGIEVGEAFASNKNIHAIAFCGSIEAGQRVLSLAANNTTPVVSLELGGKSPCLIFPSANIDHAAESIARGICYNTGQSCGALSRILVHKDCMKEVLDKAIEVLSSIKIGYYLDSPDMGPLISAEQLEKVEMYIREGRREGAILVYGGKRLQEEKLAKGYFLEPTVFQNIKPGMRITEEEVFGPVMGMMEFESEEEAINLANLSKYGLSAEIWTTNLSQAHRIAAQLDVSHVTINGGGGFGIEAPFGGVKQSGFGREGGWESILQYSRVKNIWINL